MTRMQRHTEAARIAAIRQYMGERVIAVRVERTLARAIRARMGERDARQEIRDGKGQES